MKKSLLLMAGAIVAFTASAVDPSVMENVVISKVAPNGSIIVSNTDEGMQIINQVTGDISVYENDMESYYSLATGNAVSNNGIVLFSTDYAGNALYWKNDQISELSLGDRRSGFCQAITPDGSRIAGTLGIPMSIDATEIMQTPVVWNRTDDGTYGEPVKLPHPDKDWSGRMPQYVTAVNISADGKTIAGQVVDYAGQVSEPIIYREDAEGNWTYEMVHPELFKVEGIEWPEWPGESPEYPDVANFMDADKAAEYQEAIDNWDWMSGDPYPEASDYMTQEQQEAYAAAMAKYEEDSQAYGEKFDAFMDVYLSAISQVPTFSFNNVFLTEDGSKYATSNVVEGFMTIEAATPTVFDLANGNMATYEAADGANVILSYANNDGIMLGSSTGNYNVAYVLDPAKGDKFIPVEEYVKDKNSSLYEWMSENMRHDVTVWEPNEETGEWEELVINDAWITGVPVADSKFEGIYTYVTNVWDMESDIWYYSYILPFNYNLGVEGTFANNKKGMSVNIAKGGVITIDGDAASVEIYDLQGRMVYTNHAPASVINTGLDNGIYNVRVTDKAGRKVIRKASF